MAVWCSLWSFGILFTFWYFWIKKNLATLEAGIDDCAAAAEAGVHRLKQKMYQRTIKVPLWGGCDTTIHFQEQFFS
jgi:hypothetical protein